MMRRAPWTAIAFGGALAAVVALAVVLEWSRRPVWDGAATTVGDLHAVHAEVRVGGREVRGRSRISEGDQVSTGSDGRARLRLDDGTLVVVDAATRLGLSGARLNLAAGRLFIRGGPHASLAVTAGRVTTTVTGSAAAFEHRGNSSRIYCAQGELMLGVGRRQTRVSSGETATIDPAGAHVAPEKAFDDWTGGLAVPWSGQQERASALAELRGVKDSADPGVPLVVRSHDVRTRIEGEFSISRVRTVYFNGSESATRADVRVAIPPGAILSRVARRIGTRLSEARLRIGREEPSGDVGASDRPRLEWVGEGSLQGTLGEVVSGETVELNLEYGEWLPTRGDRTTYRFPMAIDTDPVLIGELSAHIDVSRTKTRWMTGSTGMVASDGALELRRADARPTGDLVVEFSPSVIEDGIARAYVAPDPEGEDPYVMVRTEVPERTEAGVTLAVVLDTSMSVGAATLETERVLLDALLEGLGPRDSIVVLAADQRTSPVGPDVPKPVTPDSRAKLRAALAKLRPGGASNLGVALQRAADALDAPSRGKRAGTGMVVYLGDGRPTVGDPDAEQLRRRLRRRAGGMPRLAAVAVGPGADRWMLAHLVTGAGSVYEVADRSDAARVGAELLADALEPTLREVEIDLGSGIDRIYPREAQAILAGATVTVIGRLRGKLPDQVRFRFRDGGEVVEQHRALRSVALPRGADVPQRWAAARIEEMAAHGDGLEPAITLADRAGLLTPWTGWYFDSNFESARSVARRVLELSPALDAPFAPYVDKPRPTASTLLEPPQDFEGGVSLGEAAQIAIRRILNEARRAVRACRDARAAVRPGVVSQFDIEVSVGGAGRATQVRVSTGTGPARDAVLERCIVGVVKSLPYLAAGAAVTVTHRLSVPEGRGSRRTTCSPASRLSLPIRRALWMARPDLDADMYVETARSCELPAWRDRRELLLMMVDRLSSGRDRLSLAQDLDAAGETDAAGFVRKEALRRVTTFAELEELSRIVMASEPEIDGELEKAYAAARTNAERLEVVRRFLRLAPHNALARRRLLALLDAMGNKDALIAAIDNARSDPFADAGLLAAGAAALRRLGRDLESRRAFGELIERAPSDPWTLAFVGDRLRAEGLFDEATSAYESLERVMPLDAAVALRLALAHAGAERLDVATRLLARVNEAGLREDDGRLGELASIVQAVLLAGARAGSKNPPSVQAELGRRLARTPLPDVASVVLVQAPPASDPLEVRVARDEGDREPVGADFDARVLGLAAVRLERGDSDARILITRKADPGPSAPTHARIAALVLGADRSDSRLVTREVEVRADGKAVELRWNGETFYD